MSLTTEQIELMKKASVQLKSLQQENADLKDKYERLLYANEVAFNLLKQGNLVAEDLELYIKEASTKNKNELKLIKEASVFIDNSQDTFSVSTKNENSENDADLESFLLSLN